MLHPKTFWEMRGVLIRLLEGLSPSRAPLKSVYVSTFIELRPDISIQYLHYLKKLKQKQGIYTTKKKEKMDNKKKF